MLLLTQFDPTADDSIPVNITLVMLVGAAAIPFRPTDMLVFGFLVESIYVLLAMVTQGSIQHRPRGGSNLRPVHLHADVPGSGADSSCL